MVITVEIKQVQKDKVRSVVELLKIQNKRLRKKNLLIKMICTYIPKAIR